MSDLTTTASSSAAPIQEPTYGPVARDLMLLRSCKLAYFARRAVNNIVACSHVCFHYLLLLLPVWQNQ